MRIALCGIHEEVNTFAVETVGLATITGDMVTGFQRTEGRAVTERGNIKIIMKDGKMFKNTIKQGE